MSSMLSVPHAVPGLKSLYGRDLIIKRAVNTVGFMLFAAWGIRWATEPARTGKTLPDIDVSFEIVAGKWGPIGALVLAAVAALVVGWRLAWVRKVLTQGSVVKAVVEDLEVTEVNKDFYEYRGGRPAPWRFYWATVRYAVHGVERTVRVKMPNAGFVFGLQKGEETEVVVLDQAPGRPLIRAIYLGEPLYKPRRKFFW